MKKRIYRSMSLLTFFAVVLTSVLMAGVLCYEFYGDLREGIRNEAAHLAAGLELMGDDYLRKLQSTNRITLFGPEQEVLYDNAYDPGLLGGVVREEVTQALATGRGEVLRRTERLNQYTFYCAVRLSDGRVVRVADYIISILGALAAILPALAGTAAVASLASLLVAHRATAKIVAPINAVNLENPVAGHAYEEITPLLERIRNQKEELEQQIAQLVEYQRELAAITGQMDEGLVMLGNQGEILSMNRSAAEMLGLSLEKDRGKTVAQTGGDRYVQAAVDKALHGEAVRETAHIGEQILRVIASPVQGESEQNGVVLLLMDITEQAAVEALRREFSANVSHELKTPLTSISGYAEILKEGLVKPEDVPRFAGRIHREATALVRLVEDILRLSRIEENDRPDWEPVDLLETADRVAVRLGSTAREQDVSIAVEGESAVIQGSRGILEELCFNLAENAIKYNRPGGWVKISVHPLARGARLVVEDSGVGIAPQEQERVFERFYRVDKSHSREKGGSGLGLSIVKHAARHHGAGIRLTSTPGTGTAVQVEFPDLELEKEQAND